ncbi:hypothetical protein DKT69_20120 [Micromonospora sicca]|uniref:Uncharacterized protein n=1 Tax=Micromonospora sicca TaxID=2202420 RepID=A0A317DIT7_9ACTN|nr:hypothetical protein DKT69_20120 [Micromonospora sp. 4G51]
MAKTSFEPPWIVVDRSLEQIIVARWPGRLFRVAVVPPSSAAERAAMARAAQGLVSGAGYVRALAVDVLAELPPALLFGSQGRAIVEVIEVARSLTEERATLLASADHPAAGETYSAAWARWTGTVHAADERDRDHSATIGHHQPGRATSPIGAGFTVLHTAVTDSAQLRGRPGALRVNPDGEQLLDETWATAGSALLHAAMAFGAPELVTGAEAAVLTAAWRAVLSDERRGTT